MFRLSVVEGRQRGRHEDLKRFPFVIGKNPDAQLQLRDPGVWEDHLVVELLAKGGPTARRLGEGVVSVNAEPVDSTKLRNGDLISLGAAVLRFSAVPAPRKALMVQNAAAWFLVGAIALMELALLVFLLNT